MVNGQRSLRRAVKVGAFVVSLVLALAVPCIALAANTASFSGATPGSGASISVYKPTIMVTVYDKYGVSGSTNYSLTLDGVKKPTTITRSVGWGLRKFKLSYAVPANLSLGSHTVVARVKDKEGHVSTLTWRFTVLDGTAPVTTSDVMPNYLGSATIHLSRSDNVGVTHTYYMVDLGGQTEGTTILVNGVGFHWISYWSVDAAGNVETPHMATFLVSKTIGMSHALPQIFCTTIPGCHASPTLSADDTRTTDLPSIHDGKCFMCHGAGVTPINSCNATQCHGANGPHGTHAVITSTSDPSCTSCHSGNVITQVHDLGDGRSVCLTCHDPDPNGFLSRDAVLAAIAAGGAHCETCHGSFTQPSHAAAAGGAHDASELNLGCFYNGCHGTDALVIHNTTLPGGPSAPGCAACHDAGTAPSVSSVSCTQVGCHPTGIAVHTNPALPGAHLSSDSCAGVNDSTCHVTNVATIHTTTLPGGPAAPGCVACHVVGTTPSTVCADCHDGFNHSDPALSVHDATTNAYWSGCSSSSDCHDVSSDVSVIHSIWAGAPGCVACHAPSETPSVDCLGCHSHQPFPHTPSIQAAAHEYAGLATACKDCHGTNLITEHGTYGVTCANCHKSTDARVMAAIVADNTACYACHAGTGSNPNLNSKFHGTEFTATSNASGHNVAGNLINGFAIGAKTRFDGSQGVVLKWEATESTTLAGFADGRNGTYVEGQIATMTTAWDFPTVNTFWAADTTQAPPSATVGLTKDSVVTCSGTNGCHDAAAGIQASGPHGSTQTWALDPNYPGDYSYAELTKYVTANLAFPVTNAAYNTPLSTSGIAMFPGAATHADITSSSVNSTVGLPAGTTALGNRTDGTRGATAVICAKCHDLENYYPGGVDGTGALPTVEGGNTAHDSHHQDQLDGSAQCVNCHVGIPHGWKMPRLLVDTDVDSAPYRDPQQIGTTRTTSTGNNTGNTIKLTSGNGQGFNGQGMQALSGVNDHTLGGPGGTQPYGTGDGLPTAALNLGHVGMAYWSEPQCQACGDHTGETPAQIINN